MRIEVKDSNVRTKTVTSRQSGKQSDIREQEAYAHLGGAYPERIVLNLRDRAPWPVGSYTLGPRAFYVGQFGKLSLDLGELVPVAAAAGPKAA